MQMKKIIIVMMIFLLCSCGRNHVSDDFFAMDTYMQIISLDTAENCSDVKKLVFAEDKKLRRGNIDLTDDEIISIVKRACRISEKTDGAFDITVAPLCDIWGFWDKNFRVPTEKETAEALKKTGYDKIFLSDEGVILPDGFSLDLGAVAKGYTGDLIRDMLTEKGTKNALISLGGNIVALGTKDGRNPWSIGIKNPFGDGYAGYVEVTDKSVVTSGGYERFFQSNGIKYSHIINPKTGKPADSDIASVTVISSDGFLADALSTAFYVLGSKKSESLITSSDCTIDGSEFSVVMILNDKSIKTFGNVTYKNA